MLYHIIQDNLRALYDIMHFKIFWIISFFVRYWYLALLRGCIQNIMMTNLCLSERLHLFTFLKDILSEVDFYIQWNL